MIQVCRDTSDAVALYLPQRLYLKSFAKLNISVQLPTHKVHGKAISNWELMEKLRKMIQPEVFSVLKVSKHSSEVIRFDAEIENRNKLDRVIFTLEDRVIKLTDYPDDLKVRVSEARCDFPSRHAWDSHFRDATDMDEMKPGERPDTVHITNIPIRWFVHERDRHEDAPPSESIFRRVFDKFGEVRQVDIPAADPFRMQMKSSMRGITTPPQDAALYFEGYVQFSEYVGFVRCMDALRGCKLLRKKDDLAEWVSIKVDFDKSKHMTDAAVKRRAIVRERLLTRQRAKEDEEKQEKDKKSKREEKERLKHERTEKEKLERMRDREERRKKKQLALLMEKEDVDLNTAVYEEEKKLLKVQKKLQAVRLMEELFRRIEIRHSGKNGRRDNRADMSARARLVERSKRELEQQLAEQRERFMQALDGRIVIRSALETKKPKPRASSISSISSDERALPKRVKTEKLTTPERETELKKTLGMYGMPAYGYPGFPFAAMAPGYPFPQTSMYYGPPAGAVGGAYYPPPHEYAPRRPYRGRGGRGRGRGRFDKDSYYHNRYHEGSRYEHDDRTRSRSRSRSRRRSHSRSRSRSRHRSRSRSRSRRRSYTRSRTHSRGRRSRSRRSRSHSRKRSRSHSRRRSKSNQRSSPATATALATTTTPAVPAITREERASVDSSTFVSPNMMRQRRRSKSWSLPKEGENGKAWSKSPKEKTV